tara:strand:+ start:2906 stop:3853 length:948 start_codon:yes stop_codon:yes gene_type:complete
MVTEGGMVADNSARRQPNALATMGWLIVMGAAWGLEFSMFKLAVEAGLPEIGILMVALVLVVVAFGAVIAWKHAWFRLNAEIIVFLIVVAVLGYVLPLLAALWAASHVGAGMMTLIASFTPIVTVATALLFRTEHVSLRRILAVTFGMIAGLMVLAPGVDLTGSRNFGWLLLVFVVPLTYGVESVYVWVKWPAGLSPLQIGAGQAAIALLGVIPLHLLTEPAMAYDPAWPVSQWAVILVGFLVLVEVFLYFAIIRDTGGVLVSFSFYISLFAGIAWGVTIFGEVFDWVTWIAVVALMIGLALTVQPAGTTKGDTP